MYGLWPNPPMMPLLFGAMFAQVLPWGGMSFPTCPTIYGQEDLVTAATPDPRWLLRGRVNAVPWDLCPGVRLGQPSTIPDIRRGPGP